MPYKQRFVYIKAIDLIALWPLVVGLSGIVLVIAKDILRALELIFNDINILGPKLIN